MDSPGFQKLPSDAERKVDLDTALSLYYEKDRERWPKVAAAAGLKPEELIMEMLPDFDRPVDNIGREFIDSMVCPSSTRSISKQNDDDGASTDDGYNWREYGRRTVSLDPNSVYHFYKCKQSSCSATRRIRREKDGRMTVAFRGIHNHEASRKELNSGLENLKSYFSLFPVGYEFDEDTMVQLWMAEGDELLGGERTDGRMEEIACQCFGSLLQEGFIVPSGYDHSRSKTKYRVDEAKIGTRSIIEDDKLGDIPENARKLSLLCRNVDLATFKTISKCKDLATLLLFPCHGSCFKCIPRHFFLSLKLLRILNLSQSCLTELPSSIGSLKSLRYLDISETPIKWLPEALSCLQDLHTLKLICCLNIHKLPNDTRKLINLRHLDLDVGRQLISMPTGMGFLTNLQSLSAFLVDDLDGCRIGELKNLNNLRGKFCLLRLEKVVNSDEAREAALCDKKYLDKLELQWSELCYEEVEEQEEILENLQPYHDLKELIIYCYGGSKLASWISNPSYANLVSISFYKCGYCQFLPSIGVLPSLKVLYINEMNGVKQIDNRFFRNGTDQGVSAFPKLEKLEIDVMLGLEEWKEIEIDDLACLLELTLEYCPELVTLPSFSGLKSLKRVKILECPKLQSLPEGLPTSLEFLLVMGCPLVKERCNTSGEDWPKVAHVPSVWIEQEKISSESKAAPSADY